MAGLDFNISPNLTIELGCRYLNYGSIATGGPNWLAGNIGGTFNLANCAGGVPNTISSRNMLASNDFRLGLIYTLGETPPPPSPYPSWQGTKEGRPPEVALKDPKTDPWGARRRFRSRARARRGINRSPGYMRTAHAGEDARGRRIWRRLEG